MRRPHHVADLSGDVAIVAFSNSPRATPATRSTSRVTVADLHRLPEESLRRVRRVALTQVRAAKDDTRRRPWLRMWSHAHFLLTARDGLAASDSQRMRARPFTERMADARRALGLPAPPSPVTLADQRGPDGTISAPTPPRVPARQRVPVSREHARQALAAMTGDAGREETRQRAQEVRAAMSGQKSTDAVQQRAAGISASMRGERSAELDARVRQARSALGLDR